MIWATLPDAEGKRRLVSWRDLRYPCPLPQGLRAGDTKDVIACLHEVGKYVHGLSLQRHAMLRTIGTDARPGFDLSFFP